MIFNKKEKDFISASRVADLISDIGATLLASGAHCGRIRRNVLRVGDFLNFDIQLFLSYTGVSVTVKDKKNERNVASRNRQAVANTCNYSVLTDISLLTWDTLEKKLSIDEVEKSLESIKKKPRYNVWKVRAGIALAGLCLCLSAGGNFIDGLFAASASILGLTLRQELQHRNFNTMIAVLAASALSTLISGIDVVFELGHSPQTAVATSVLYLIPGVPLINSIIDIFEGFIPTAIARGAFAAFLLLCIAIGMFFSISILGINKF